MINQPNTHTGMNEQEVAAMRDLSEHMPKDMSHGGFCSYMLLNNFLGLVRSGKRLWDASHMTVADLPETTADRIDALKKRAREDARCRRREMEREKLQLARRNKESEDAARLEQSRLQTQMKRFLELMPAESYMTERILAESGQCGAVAADGGELPLHVHFISGADDKFRGVADALAAYFGGVDGVEMHRWITGARSGSSVVYNLNMLMRGIPTLLLMADYNVVEGKIYISATYWERNAAAHPTTETRYTIDCPDYSAMRQECDAEILTALKIIASTVADASMLVGYGRRPSFPVRLADDYEMLQDVRRSEALQSLCKRDYAELLLRIAGMADGDTDSDYEALLESVAVEAESALNRIITCLK